MIRYLLVIAAILASAVKLFGIIRAAIGHRIFDWLFNR